MARGMSVHVGLNSFDPDHYGSPGTLKACENDARDMARIAEDQGFEPTVLLTREATTDAVTAAISSAAQSLGREDILLATYAGHGGQVEDKNGDEGDLNDETWCLWDRQLVDDELYDLWASFTEGVRIVVVSDSCHSGSVTRDLFAAATRAAVEKGAVEEERTRDLPPDVQQEVNSRHARLYEQIQEDHPDAEKQELGASVILLSGCQDNQLSLDGSKNGLFTEHLKQAWQGGAFVGGYKPFRKAIGDGMPPSQSPNYFVTGRRNPSFERQRPFTIDAA